MKKRTILLTLIALAAFSIASAQDVDKILDSHFKAIGQKSLLKVNSMHAKGSISIMGMEGTFEMKQMRPNSGCVIMDIGGSVIKQAYDGETVWQLNPMAGITTPTKVTGPEAENLMDIGDMDGALYDFEKKGNKVELQGSEDLNGNSVFVLKLTRPSGTNAYYYIDKDEYLIRKVRSTTVSNGMDMEIESLPSNYKKVSGYMMPYEMELRSGPQIFYTVHFDEISTDVDLDASEFSMTQ